MNNTDESTLVLNLDNGPENHSRRTQFIARLGLDEILWIDRQLTFRNDTMQDYHSYRAFIHLATAAAMLPTGQGTARGLAWARVGSKGPGAQDSPFSYELIHEVNRGDEPKPTLVGTKDSCATRAVAAGVVTGTPRKSG